MRDYKIKINGNEYNVAIKETDGDVAEVEVNGTHYHVEVERAMAQVKTPKLVQVATVPTADSHKALVKTAAPDGINTVKAPLPGVILDVYVKEGSEVAVGQKLILLEAMKMENTIEADRAGKVTAIKVRKGDSVLEGAELVTIS